MENLPTCLFCKSRCARSLDKEVSADHPGLYRLRWRRPSSRAHPRLGPPLCCPGRFLPRGTHRGAALEAVHPDGLYFGDQRSYCYLGNSPRGLALPRHVLGPISARGHDHSPHLAYHSPHPHIEDLPLPRVVAGEGSHIGLRVDPARHHHRTDGHQVRVPHPAGPANYDPEGTGGHGRIRPQGEEVSWSTLHPLHFHCGTKRTSCVLSSIETMTVTWTATWSTTWNTRSANDHETKSDLCCNCDYDFSATLIGSGIGFGFGDVQNLGEGAAYLCQREGNYGDQKGKEGVPSARALHNRDEREMSVDRNDE